MSHTAMASTVCASLLFSLVAGYPRLASRSAQAIGPSCTIGAHWKATGSCPTMKQTSAPGPAARRAHMWPEAFTIDWQMYFVPDKTDMPPYSPAPRTPHNLTNGRTWYSGGGARMRESYYNYCIPVFPEGPMATRNDFACDFINVENVSYVVIHAPRPAGVPACCIVGKPFHPPPRDFHQSFPRRWSAKVGTKDVDWGAVWDRNAGIFNYGFEADTADVPFAFYMEGVPPVATWLWQPFSGLVRDEPDPSVWTVPDECSTATACPGWEPEINNNLFI